MLSTANRAITRLQPTLLNSSQSSVRKWTELRSSLFPNKFKFGHLDDNLIKWTTPSNTCPQRQKFDLRNWLLILLWRRLFWHVKRRSVISVFRDRWNTINLLWSNQGLTFYEHDRFDFRQVQPFTMSMDLGRRYSSLFCVLNINSWRSGTLFPVSADRRF